MIKYIGVDSEISCQFECLGEDQCQSYNFGTSKTNPERFECQLSASDRFFGLANFTEDADFQIQRTAGNVLFTFINIKKVYHYALTFYYICKEPHAGRVKL